MKFIALCAQGLENIVVEEIKDQGDIENIEIYPGIVVFDFKDNIKKLLDVKTADDILVFVKKFSDINRYKKSLWELRKQLSSVNFKKNLFTVRKIRRTKPKTTFTINSSYKGRRDYTAREITNSIKRIITKNQDWDYKEDAELYFHAILTNKVSLLGLSLKKLPFHVLRRIKTIPGSLKSSVANALIRLAEVNKEDVVLDPMCGSGMIAIEAGKITKQVLAGDIDKNSIKIAKENSKDIKFQVWDSRNTKIKEKSVDKIICNLPFGKQVELEKDFLKDFIKEMKRVSKKDSTWVFLTANSDEIKKLVKVEKEIKIVNSGLESRILVIKDNDL